jgi:hypothetical protein
MMAMNGLINAILCFDDIILHLRNHLEDREQLENLFIRLRNARLKGNSAKCKLGYTNVSYPGYGLTLNGI